MHTQKNRQWRVVKRPQGMIEDSDFSFTESPIPTPADGEVLVRTLMLSCDPAQRGWLNEGKSYVEPVALGDVMRAYGLAQVVESRHPDFRRGETVLAGVGLGWQDYAVLDPKKPAAINKLPPGIAPMHFLNVLGMTGITAYFGLLEVGKPQPGETVVVSGAAGATGSVVAQIARLKGCRAVGIAGGDEKCRWLREECGLDGVIDYKREDVGKQLRAHCPSGINVFFDNVGGELLDTALTRLARGARVVICGGIAVYNDASRGYALRNVLSLLVNRARMEGFVVFDYQARYPEAIAALSGWLREGKIKHLEDVAEGLENAPATLRRLFLGQNVGKQLLKVADADSSLA